MAKLQRGTTFGTGTYTGTDLNNLVDAATILPGAITEQTAASSVAAGDSFMLYSVAASDLRKCTLTQIIAGFPTDGAAGTASLRTLGTGATQAAPGNDTRFSATITAGKIRLAGTGGLPANDTNAGPKDFSSASVNLGSSTTIDWDTGDIFYFPNTAGNKTFTFSNARDGRSIVLVVPNNGITNTLTFPVTFGTIPVYVAGVGYNIYCFESFQTVIAGQVRGV